MNRDVEKLLPGVYSAPKLLFLGKLRLLIRGAGTPNSIDFNLGACTSSGDQGSVSGSWKCLPGFPLF